MDSSPFERRGLREQQRVATRERVFDAAMAEFCRVGFENAVITDIARSAGVSRPSFYAHFPTREHVLYEALWRSSLEVVRRLEGSGDLRGTLEQLAEALIDAEESVGNPALYREMLGIFARRPPDLDLDTPIPVFEVINERFRAARDRGELRAGLDPEQAAVLCLSGVFGYLLGVDVTPDERREDLRTLFGLFLADKAT